MAVRAAGTALWRRRGAGVEVAVVHRPRYDDWSLPKGKLEAHETAPAAAVRETREETGLRCALQEPLGTSSYDVLVQGRLEPKTVWWWAAQALDGAFTPTAEVDELRWLPPEQARGLLTAGRDVAVLDALTSRTPGGPLALVVRHVHAGDRLAWPGRDEDRPLSTQGLQQARHLAALLALWCPVRLVSAPPLRCTATLAPLGRMTGLPVEVDGRLADAAASADVLDELLAGPGPVVACGQGGALQALLPGGPRTAKGAGWLVLPGDHAATGRPQLAGPLLPT